MSVIVRDSYGHKIGKMNLCWAPTYARVVHPDADEEPDGAEVGEYSRGDYIPIDEIAGDMLDDPFCEDRDAFECDPSSEMDYGLDPLDLLIFEEEFPADDLVFATDRLDVPESDYRPNDDLYFFDSDLPDFADFYGFDDLDDCESIPMQGGSCTRVSSNYKTKHAARLHELDSESGKHYREQCNESNKRQQKCRRTNRRSATIRGASVRAEVVYVGYDDSTMLYFEPRVIGLVAMPRRLK